jgi:hypothetical protein
MRRILAIGGLLALAAPLLVLVPSTVEPAYAFPPTGGIGWKYHEGSRSYYQDPPSAPGEAGPSQRPTRYVDWGSGDMAQYECPTEYDGSPFECAGNENDPTNDFCNSLPGENGRPVAPRVIFERVFDNPAQTGNPPWEPLPPADWDGEHFVESCHELPEEYVVTQEEIQEVNFEVFQQLTGLEIDVYPARPDGQNRTLVNLSTIVSTRYPANVGNLGDDVIEFNPEADPPNITIEGQVDGKVEPFIYTIRADAAINWTFEGGNPQTAEGRGRAFDGTLPEDAPAGHYVTAQFQRAGTYSISLGATWTGTVTVDGRTEEMEPVVIAAVTEPIQVSEAESVIVD